MSTIGRLGRRKRRCSQLVVCVARVAQAGSYLEPMTRILYFGVARDLAGRDAEELELGAAATVDGLWELLLERHPSLDRVRGIARLAIDMEYAVADSSVAGAAEIAIIPPVAGG
jgi:molybdopterin converting factor subunit 1